MAETKEGNVKEGVRIMRCNCEHAVQDEIYGKGMRVHNVSKSGRAVCTVCVPNYRLNRMQPAEDLSPSVVLGHGFVPKKRDREKLVKKVA